MEFYQACYGKPGNNWELLNLSPNTPPPMVNCFEKIGNGCTPQNIGSENSVREDGSPLNLYQIVSDNHILCVLRAIYGERDTFGRPKMFAHGFMFPAEGLLLDPAALVSVTDENFRLNAEDSKTIPTALALDAGMAAKCAAPAGFAPAMLEKMMACIHLSLASPTDYPTYVVGNFDDETVKALIGYIWQSLPYALRYQLSFANADTLRQSKCKSVMFVHKAPAGEKSISLETGDTTVDLTELQQEEAKFVFFHRFCRDSAAGFAAYCQRLHALCGQLELPYNCPYDDVLLADMVLQGTDGLQQKDPTELTRHLLEVLTRASVQNPVIDDYIARILMLFDQRKIVPNDTVLRRIELRNENTVVPELTEVYKRIRMQALLNKGTDAIVAFLVDQYAKSKSVFDDWSYSLAELPNGLDAVAVFYEEQVRSVAQLKDIISLDKEIVTFFTATSAGQQLTVLKNAEYSRCVDLLKNQISPANLMTADFDNCINAFRTVCVHLFPTVPAATIDNSLADVKQSFWAAFRLNHFAFRRQCIDNCKNLYISTPRYEKTVPLLLKLYDEVSAYPRAPYASVEQVLLALIDAFNYSSEDSTGIADAVSALVLEKLAAQEGHLHFAMWHSLAKFGDPLGNPIMQMIKWELPIIRDGEAFEQAFALSRRMQEMASSILLYLVGHDQKSGVLPNVENNAELYKTIKREAKFLQEHAKRLAAEQREQEKEQQRADKMRQKLARQESKAKPPMPAAGKDKPAAPAHAKGLFGFMGKKKDK